MARLNTALTNFRAAVDRAYPNRDRTSDGWIGDPAHQARTSDHNPDEDGTVDAWDMDVDLRSSNDRAAIEALKDVFEAHPAARYWIHNGQIAHRSTGWRREPYNGTNPHDKHVHWNSNEATENSTAPWNVEDDMTPQELLDTRVGSPSLGDRTVADWLKGGETARRAAVDVGVKVDALAAAVALIAEKVDIDPTELAAITTAAREGAASAADDIVTRILAGLPEGTLTRDDVEAAVREVLLTGALPPAQE